MDLVLPLCTFPNVYWWTAFRSAESPVIDLSEHYVKQSYRNRFDIFGHQGRLGLSFPIRKESGAKLPQSEIALLDEKRWKTLNWRSVLSAYNSSPYFSYYSSELEALFRKEHGDLQSMNLDFLSWCFGAMRTQNEPRFSAEYIDPTENLIDLRGCFKGERWRDLEFGRYYQVFEEQNGFVPNLSILDVLFNLGPEAQLYIAKEKEKRKLTSEGYQ